MTRGAVTPGWLNKIRFITFYAFNPCEAPFGLYIEMAREPAHNTALVFLEFDLFALVKRFFRPIGLRSRRHGRKGSRSGRGLRGVPEIADLVAEVLPGQEEFSLRKYGVGTRLLYLISDTFERVTWNIFLVELSTNFVFDSIYGVIQDDRAKCADIARLSRQQEFAIEGGAGPVWRPHNLVKFNYGVNYASGTGFGASCFTAPTICVFAATMTTDQPEISAAIRLVGGIGGNTVLAESAYVTIQAGEFQDFIVEADVARGDFVQWQISALGGFARVIKSDVLGLQIDN